MEMKNMQSLNEILSELENADIQQKIKSKMNW